MAIWENIGMQAATATTGGALGMIFGGMNDRRQLKQQEKLNKQAEESNRRMMDYSNLKQMEMWNNTNYDAQVGQMEKAGLNPALLYGMAGGGAVTTGTQQGGIHGGQAQQGGGGEIAMGMQLGMMQAQKEVLQTQATKNQAEADSIRGAEGTIGAANIATLTEGLNNLKADATMKKAETRLLELDAKYAEETLENRINGIANDVQKGAYEVRIAAAQANLDEKSTNDKLKIYTAEAIGKGLQNILTKAQTNYTNQQTAESKSRIKVNDQLIEKMNAEIIKMANDTAQKWVELQQNGQKLSIEQMKGQQEVWFKQWEMQYPGFWNTLGGAVQQGASGIKALEDAANNLLNKIYNAIF